MVLKQKNTELETKYNILLQQFNSALELSKTVEFITQEKIEIEKSLNKSLDELNDSKKCIEILQRANSELNVKYEEDIKNIYSEKNQKLAKIQEEFNNYHTKSEQDKKNLQKQIKEQQIQMEKYMDAEKNICLTASKHFESSITSIDQLMMKMMIPAVKLPDIPMKPASKLKEYKKKYNILLVDISNEKEKNSKLENYVINANNKIKEQEKNIQSLIKSNDEYKLKIEKIQLENAKINEICEKVTNEMQEENDQHFKSLRNEITSAYKKNEKLKQQLTIAVTKLEQLDQSRKEKKKEINDLNNKITELKKENQTIDHQKAEIENENTNLKIINERNKTKMQDLANENNQLKIKYHKQVEAFEREIAIKNEIQLTIDEKSEEIIKLKAEKAQIDSKYETLQSNFKHLNKKLETLETTKESLLNELKASKDKIDSIPKVSFPNDLIPFDFMHLVDTGNPTKSFKLICEAYNDKIKTIQNQMIVLENRTNDKILMLLRQLFPEISNPTKETVKQAIDSLKKDSTKLQENQKQINEFLNAMNSNSFEMIKNLFDQQANRILADQKKIKNYKSQINKQKEIVAKLSKYETESQELKTKYKIIAKEKKRLNNDVVNTVEHKSNALDNFAIQFQNTLQKERSIRIALENKIIQVTEELLTVNQQIETYKFNEENNQKKIKKLKEKIKKCNQSLISEDIETIRSNHSKEINSLNNNHAQEISKLTKQIENEETTIKKLEKIKSKLENQLNEIVSSNKAKLEEYQRKCEILTVQNEELRCRDNSNMKQEIDSLRLQNEIDKKKLMSYVGLQFCQFYDPKDPLTDSNFESFINKVADKLNQLMRNEKQIKDLLEIGDEHSIIHEIATIILCE